jgi:hypothetical protein
MLATVLQREREGREGGRERERTAGCWRMSTKIRNEMLLTLETVAATDLQQSSSRAATAATELRLKRTYLSLQYACMHPSIHTYKHTCIYMLGLTYILTHIYIYTGVYVCIL